MKQEEFNKLFYNFLFPFKYVKGENNLEKRIEKIWLLFNYLENAEKKEFILEKLKNEIVSLFYLVYNQNLNFKLNFENFISTIKPKILSIMLAKEYYGKNDDRLYNFSLPSEKTGYSMLKICMGYMIKHLTVITDFIENPRKFTMNIVPVENAFIDAINYCGILYVIAQEQERSLFYACG